MSTTNNNPTETTPVDVYAAVTNRIIALLEAGTVPWRKPWTERGIPMNAVSKRPYSGINIMLLNSCNYPHNLFFTWKQIKTLGGSVLKGETGTMVIFTTILEKEVIKEGKADKQKQYFLRYYKVFNIDQCKDLPVEFLPKEGEEPKPLMGCAAIIDGMKEQPKIIHKKAGAFYFPAEDYINMPKMNTFHTAEDYFGALFHEIIHWTGHGTRLHRKGITEDINYGSEKYSEEELIAEIGACYLKSYAGVSMDNMGNNAAYIQNWLAVLKGDKKILIKAASQGQRAVEYVLNRQEDASKEEVNESIEDSVVV